MVLVMASDGSLSPSQSQESFSRNYNDGIGQGSAESELPITGEEAEEPEEPRIAAVAPRAPVPRPEILSAIEETVTALALVAVQKAAVLSLHFKAQYIWI